MTPAALASVFQDFYRETTGLLLSRQERARSVTSYETNNGYQQVIGRQEVHLSWLADAIADLGGAVPDVRPVETQVPKGTASLNAIVEADARAQQGFIDRWAPRLREVTNARHRKLLELILGEMAEHARVFVQALQGRTDMLGRHTDGKVLRGVVLPTRPGH